MNRLADNVEKTYVSSYLFEAAVCGMHEKRSMENRFPNKADLVCILEDSALPPDTSCSAVYSHSVQGTECAISTTK